jgi:SP family facilitated glucose transporter-like MFS transporter 3
LGGKNANAYGRRGAMLINAWIFLFGGLLMTFAPNVYWLIPARFIIGFASGYASVLVPVYLGEIAPPTLRGTLGTCTQFALVIGILASGLAAFPLATPTMWRYLFAGTPILAALQLLCAPLLLESPRWLLSKDPRSREAMVVLKKLRGFRSDEEVQLEVNFMQYAADKHKTRHSSAHSSGAMLDLQSNRSLRLLVACAIGLQVAQQLCGINAVFYYSTTFFTGILDNPMQGTTLVAFVNVLATWVALKMMDKHGRRELVLWSSGGMLLSTGFIILALLGYIPKLAALIAVVAYVSFFEIGLGPIPWLIVAEMFSAKYVATAMSIASQVNWACNFMVGIGFPFMIEYLGAWSFGPFACVLLITFVLTMVYLPETHGKTVEEVQRLVVGVDDEVERAMHVIRGVENYDSINHHYQRGGEVEGN